MTTVIMDITRIESAISIQAWLLWLFFFFIVYSLASLLALASRSDIHINLCFLNTPGLAVCLCSPI